MADTAVDSPNNIATNPLRPKSPLSPQLKIEPAGEWADKTLDALGSTEPISQPLAGTPGPELPGAYPYTPSTGEPGPSFEEVKETAKEYFNAAGQYVPSQEEMRKMAHSASEIMGGYIPNGVAAYLGSPLPQQATIYSPVDESETTPTADGCFVIINGGTRMSNARAPGDHNAKQEHSDISGHEFPNENASTQTQPRSLASLERRSGFNGAGTPFSYTTGAAVPNDSKLPTAAAQGLPHEDHPPGPSNNWPSEVRGHPNGVVNHGDADVQLGPTGGTVTAPNAGIAAGPGPGSGLTGPTLLQQEENEATGSAPDGEPVTMKPNGDAIVQSIKKSGGPSKEQLIKGRENRSGPGTNSPPPRNKSEKAEGGNGGEMEKSQVGKLTQDVPNTKARTHPLGKEGTQWKGVPLEEKYQAALDRDEDRGLRIGETNPNVGAGVRIESATKPDTSPGLKPVLEQMVSNTATTGHGKSASGGTAGSSKFVEEPQNNAQPTAEPTAPPRAGSPLSDPVNPHVGRATNGPKAAKLSEPGAVSQTSNARRKSGFMSRFKAWSKRLSQDKKQG